MLAIKSILLYKQGDRLLGDKSPPQGNFVAHRAEFPNSRYKPFLAQMLQPEQTLH